MQAQTQRLSWVLVVHGKACNLQRHFSETGMARHGDVAEQGSSVPDKRHTSR